MTGLPPGSVANVFQDSRQRTWLSLPTAPTPFGYLRDDKFGDVPGASPRQVRTVVEDRQGDIWVSDQQLGLLRISDSGQVSRTPWSAFSRTDFATAIAPDRVRGGLWLGFFKGGVALVQGAEVRASYGADVGLTGGWVKGLTFNSDGALWVAAEGGLSRLHDGHVATLNSTNGLPCDAVNWAIEDDTRSLWLDMACGLVRITRQEVLAWENDRTRSITATVFGSADGVRSQSVPVGYNPYVAKAADGRLWFVGAGRRQRRRSAAPSLQHSSAAGARRADHRRSPDLRRDVGRRPADTPARADPRSADRLYRAQPRRAGKEPFQLKLEGWDRDWQDMGNRRQAFYNNLPPRNYRFRVIASNNSGVWNEAGAALDFSVAPAYYQTLWFRLTMVAAALGFARRRCISCVCDGWRGNSTCGWKSASTSARGSRGICTTRCCRVFTPWCCVFRR